MWTHCRHLTLLRVENASIDRYVVEEKFQCMTMDIALTEKEIPTGIYNICSGKPRKIEEVLQGLLALSTKEIEVRKDPARMRPSEVPFFVGDGRKIFEATGWQPKTDFQAGLEKTLDYWRDR